ncbi:hypothetical protein DVH05_018853 [Phytophthora capsici]|nr:hypothetical protein DVH05_018853 [Phytophthora capsici]
MNVSIKPARAYPKPIAVGKDPPPAPMAIRRQPARQKSVLSAPKTRTPAVRDSKISLRERRLEFQRGKQGEKPHSKASPLDDPIILVQQLPDFKMPPTAPPPAPITRLESKVSTGNDADSTQSEENDLTSLPSMANLEFQRMVLQLKSVVDSDAADSDEEDENDEAPPSYSTLETLTISVLEDPTFRLALGKHLQQYKAKGPTNEVKDEEQLAVNPAHQATLTWMQNYISSLLQ